MAQVILLVDRHGEDATLPAGLVVNGIEIAAVARASMPINPGELVTVTVDILAGSVMTMTRKEWERMKIAADLNIAGNRKGENA